MRGRFGEVQPQGFLSPAASLEPLLTPVLAVRLDHVRANAAWAISQLQGSPDRWRPHLKTTKLPEAWRELARLGVRHFKCATTLEAKVFCRTVGAEYPGCDLLVAYPLQAAGQAHLGQLAAQHPEVTLSVLADQESVVASVPAGLGMFVDINPGMDRTGIPLSETEAILSLVRAFGPRFRGVHLYDGHLHQADAAERRREAHAVYRAGLDLCRRLVQDGLPVGEVVTSGTPTFLDGAAFTGFTEDGIRHRVSPGTLVFHQSVSEQLYPELKLTPAAVVLSRIVSLPRFGLATCDAGSKALAAEAGDPCAVVLGHPEWEACPPSEEHLPLRVSGSPKPGTLLALVPRHVCPTVHLHDHALLLDGSDPPIWTPVAARGHETAADFSTGGPHVPSRTRPVASSRVRSEGRR